MKLLLSLLLSSFPLLSPFSLPLIPLLSPSSQEATAAIKPILGDYYSQDKRNVMAALWEEISTCHWVAPEQPGSGVLWFKTTGKEDYIAGSKQE
jgi:hypothetical protein